MFTIEKSKNGYYCTFTCTNGLVSRYPSFDTIRDLHIYMYAVNPKYKTGIVGNVHINA